MRILYAAIDQVIPGTTGGSVHVTAVAEGLAALGHDVHVLAAPGSSPFPHDRVHWIAMGPPLGMKELRWARSRAVRQVAKLVQPEIIIERYYNFGGEGILAARSIGARTVLEVNAPVIDYPGSPKALLDRALVGEPMRRWRERLCRRADLIVTPTAAILPAEIPRSKVLELEWGADTERFRPDVAEPAPFARPPGTVALFAGAFRKWHGAIHLATALKTLHQRGKPVSAVFVGDGPELPAVRTAAEGLPNVVFTGPVPHDRMPAALASADIGVAPFDLAAHAPLTLGFYWSPLKIFEYMSAGLPVVAPRAGRLPDLVGDSQEGVLYDSPEALADALERLLDPTLRQRLGHAARERAVREYSWSAHCRALDRAMRGLPS
jgi:glycosyltransferase involved in cell wall biosynthesis